MKYAIFADVHANFQAFKAVLDYLKKRPVDRTLFLGDIVGYGAEPERCVNALRELAPLVCAGNHDNAVAGILDTDYFSREARVAVLWTRQQLPEDCKRFLLTMPLVFHTEKFSCVHGTLSHPEEFAYMLDSLQASKTFYSLEKQICFVGHLHIPGIFVEGPAGIDYLKAAEGLMLKKDRRYIVNVGSVGQPRDEDPRACVCLYDDESGFLQFERLSYDIKEAQRLIRQAGLPSLLASRLSEGR